MSKDTEQDLEEITHGRGNIRGTTVADVFHSAVTTATTVLLANKAHLEIGVGYAPVSQMDVSDPRQSGGSRHEMFRRYHIDSR